MSHDEQDQRLQLPSLISQRQELTTNKNEAPMTPVALTATHAHPRIAGLHYGAMHMHDDFNDPLSDDFWFGDVAYDL